VAKNRNPQGKKALVAEGSKAKRHVHEKKKEMERSEEERKTASGRGRDFKRSGREDNTQRLEKLV